MTWDVDDLFCDIEKWTGATDRWTPEEARGRPDLTPVYNIMKADEEFKQSAELFQKASRTYAEKVAKKQLREAVYLFAEGYDGVDIEHTPSGTVMHQWNNSPPSYGPLSAPAERYDFRGLTFADLRGGDDE